MSKDPSDFDAEVLSELWESFFSLWMGIYVRVQLVGRKIYADDDSVDDGFDLGSVIIFVVGVLQFQQCSEFQPLFLQIKPRWWTAKSLNVSPVPSPTPYPSPLPADWLLFEK